ncbi:putative mitochondrial ATP dependent DEAD-box helicase (RH) [Leptomonas pyrrhocoris]|uniref:ATP-dependent RNA helicase n=1 Tax=Leptomonas pyrrhocoris TaxID=157538 RepID=A0A0N0DWV3_LEPPY|nr:putative mitochondrial ATP dependent DEAD-box helicase (RH) [Leptomonas pyrrhocoris]KPA82231.1 putative mitochondrial ATP dependent DEAD-box helicase (RH) [Leptomonas pyrrhocoris]|eukprot:XP_015660670.1 putative mitochondrial ATP dependent DEAD-box helicase (RH) [Leptomonas pyrrhocoris]
MSLATSGKQLVARPTVSSLAIRRALPSRGQAAALWVACRGVVQSNNGSGLRSLLDQYEDYNLSQRLKQNRNGNYYRLRQKLWPSQEALEKNLTEITYHPVERQPLALLGKRNAPRQVFACEGRGGTALLEAVEQDQQDASKAKSGNEYTSNNDDESVLQVHSSTEDDVDFMESLMRADQSVNNKIMTDADARGTTLESARTRAALILERDLTENTLLPLRVPQASSDPAGSSWSALSLDPRVSSAAEKLFGAAPTRLQARLVPALLNEDHNDVLFNGVTGSGKTSALLLAMLHGIRNEEVGMNVLVATNTMNAMRMHATVKALCERVGGGALVDRPADDYSWMLLGTYREDYETYYRLLRRGLRRNHGPARLLITTADVMCELLFEKKMEFEDFGYLRRVYVDDVGAQVPMIDESAPVAEARERLRNPLAAELLLGTLHQMPGPHIRSVLQLGMVSADVDGKLKDYLQALCMKPVAQTTVLSAVRVPSTVHCLFSFYVAHREERFAYLARLVWNARDTIPGRAVIFLSDTEDVLAARRRLRGLGMDVKLFSEIYGDQRFQGNWKFVLLKESEAFGVDLPLVSHVFITFAPTTWQRYLHMCGRTGRLGNVGWVYTVCDKLEAKVVRHAAEALSVDFCHHVVDANLNEVPARDVERQTKLPELYGLDPQFVVRQHYEVQTENPDMAYRKREFFSKPAVKQFQMEDYTPAPVKQRRFNHAKQLSRDVEQNPSLAMDMQKKGMLDAQLKPTQKLQRYMDFKTSKRAPDPFAKKSQ